MLDWGNERKFRLVIRQDLTESLFELKKVEYYTQDSTAINEYKKDTVYVQLPETAKKIIDNKLRNDTLENSYPFQSINTSEDTIRISLKGKDSLGYNRETLRINKIPKVYGDPVTAIELPWRLIISPRLPDSRKFKFKWDIPETDIVKAKGKAGKGFKDNDYGRHKLWTATLSITERTDENYKAWVKYEKEKNEENKAASTGSLNDIINQLELMILGSPDYNKKVLKNVDFKNNIDFLPTDKHRNDLVALYIKLKIVARTEKLTLSALGSTIQIHLKNNKIEEALRLGIGVIEWNQIISLGRDEKVEVSTLFLEAEFGHKMAYIIIAERKLKNGVYPLIRKEFIMPLDITKDYTNHITQKIKKVGKEDIQSRFNSPFKKITFLETKPKEIKPGIYKQDKIKNTEVNFEFEAIDWHDNIIKFKKVINALPFGAAVDFNKTNPNVEKIISPEKNEIFLPDTLHNEKNPYLDKTDSIHFFRTDTLENRNNVPKKIDRLDILISQQRDSTNKFPGRIDKFYFAETDEVKAALTGYFEDIFEIYKFRISTILKNTNDKSITQIESILTLLSTPEKIKEELLAKYIFINKDAIEKIKDALKKIKAIVVDSSYTQESIKNFIVSREPSEIDLYLRYKYVKADSEYNKNKAEIDAFLQIIKNPKENIETIIQSNKKTWELLTTLRMDWNSIDLMENWTIYIYAKNIVDPNFNKTPGTNEYLIYNILLTSYPEIIKAIDAIKQINKKIDTAGKEIIANINNRLKILFEIENTINDIPNIILLQKQKIGYALKEKYDKERQKIVDKIESETGQAKKSLSELESEYIIFNGALRQAEKETFDFFHEYAIIPQVKQAKVYVSTLSKLINEDIPISINYPIEYLQNQVRDTEFEVKQNAAMVFAEVQQYSREQINGVMKRVSDQMPGFNVEVPAHYLTYLRNPNPTNIEVLEKLDYGTELIARIRDISKDLIFISTEVKDAVKTIEDLQTIDPKKYFKDLGAKLFGSIPLENILDIGFDMPRITELPDKILYQFTTNKFVEHRAAFVVFKPNVSIDPKNPTKLDLFIDKSLKKTNDIRAFTQLNNFSVGVIIGGTEVLTVIFEQFKITSSPNQPKKTEVSIRDVKLGGPLEFIADLAKKFMAPGNGMRVRPGPRNLQIDYSIALPDIVAPSFNFKNLQLVVGVNIPYDPAALRPISFTFGVNKPEDKFLVSAGIYGGRGHFLLRATPKGIEQIDIAIELGAYASIDLGIGKGEVFLFLGFWFVCGKDENGENLIKAVAYVICSGSATVLGFISIGVSVLISLTYVKRGQQALFYGEAVVTYSVKVAFFKKEFSIHYVKEIAGSDQGNETHSTPTTGFILLDVTAPGGNSHSKEHKEKVSFTDVFENEKALEEYISCFA